MPAVVLKAVSGRLQVRAQAGPLQPSAWINAGIVKGGESAWAILKEHLGLLSDYFCFFSRGTGEQKGERCLKLEFMQNFLKCNIQFYFHSKGSHTTITFIFLE